MRTLKRAGASMLALGVAAAGMVMSAPVASAHTGTLTTSSVCQDDGTYKITYTGTTSNVPAHGSGHVATLTVGEIKPAGTTIAGAPATVTGNTTYGFTQTVPGTAKSAAATAFLVWGDGVKSDPIGTIALGGDCTPPAPVCVAHITNNQIAAHYTTDAFHATVSYTGNKPLCDNASRVVSLNSYQAEGPTWPTSGNQAFVDHDQVTIDKTHTTGNLSVDQPSCFYQTDLYFGSTMFNGVDGALPHYPNVVTPTGLIDERNGGSGCHQTPPSGDLTASCVHGGGSVVATNLDSGTASPVTWRLVSGIDSSHTTVVAGPTAGAPLEASGLADATKVWLQFNIGHGFVDEGSVITTGSCTPVVVPPSGDLDTSCVNGFGHVEASNLSNGTATSVMWRLVSGTDLSHTTVVAGPTAGAPLAANRLADATKVWLQVDTGSGFADEGSAVTTDNCTPTVVPPAGSFTVVCSDTGAIVNIGTLSSGTSSHVVWTLTFGSGSKTVSSGDVVAVPALAELALNFTAGGGDSHKVQSATAPAACQPTGDRSLGVVKTVLPAGDVKSGDTLTYTLVVTAGGTLGETNVVVSDYIPGYKPGRESGLTTYVPDSAICDPGTCVATYDDTAKLVTWGLGDMAPATSRTVTFQVTVDSPVTSLTDAPVETTIFNSATVGSTETATLASNEVANLVPSDTAVLGVKHGHQPGHGNQPTAVQADVLPHTGAAGELTWTLGAAALFLLLGSALIMAARKPEVTRAR